MFYLLTGVLILIIIPFWILKKYEKDFIRRKVKRGDVFYHLYPAGMYLFDLWYHKYGKNSKQNQWAEAVYVYDVPKEQLRMRGAKRIVRLWVCLAAALVSGIVLSWQSTNKEQEEAKNLPRPAIGRTESYELEVTGIEEEPLGITVTVNGKQPEDKELQEVFDKAFENVAAESLGENQSLEEIRSDLELVSVTDYGIRVQWESLNPELISSKGRIVADEISEDGELVILRATLSYGTYQAFYDLLLHLLPREKDSSYYYGVLLEQLDEEDKTGRKSDVMKLPETVDGKTVHFFYPQKEQPWILLLILLIVGILLFMADCENMKKEYEDRNQQLLRDYPSLLFKLSIMLGCGITLRGAWYRIVEGYQAQKKWTGIRYVYEEMIAVQRRIDSGDGEAASYLMFGQRCKADCYLRLGTYLEQNIRQGVSGIQGMLEAEMNHALEDRRHLALRMGEAMNTRLLLPMVLMLGVVIVILMAPAMLSM